MLRVCERQQEIVVFEIVLESLEILRVPESGSTIQESGIV